MKTTAWMLLMAALFTMALPALAGDVAGPGALRVEAVDPATATAWVIEPDGTRHAIAAGQVIGDGYVVVAVGPTAVIVQKDKIRTLLPVDAIATVTVSGRD